MLTRESRRSATGWLSWPWHVLLLGAYPALFLYAQNVDDQVTLDPLWVPLVICVAGAAALLVGLFALRRDWARAGLMASVVLAVFFSFGHVWNEVDEVLDQKWVLAVVWLVWGVALIGLAWRGGSWVKSVTQALNVVVTLLVLLNLMSIGGYLAETRVFAGVNGELPSVRVGDAGRPDVYYIVFDRYAGEETLREFYDFDNTPFLEALEERGFSVAHDSWANYFKTALSMFGTLTMEHIDSDRWNGSNPDTFGPIHAALQARMAVPATFKALGYEYVHIANWWQPTSSNVDADVIYRYTQETEFGTILFNTTLVGALLPGAETDDQPEQIQGMDLQRAHVLTGFNALLEASRRPGPTFTLAHLTTPHPPYAFNVDGSKPTQAQRESRSSQEEYVIEVEYTNKRALEVIDAIIDNVEPGQPDPIIILQTDEGPFPPRFAQPNSENFQWLEATDQEIAWKFNILTAYRLPGVDDAAEGFNDRTSPVNAFRILFNAYFDAGLELLPDVTYLSPDTDHMYDFVEYPR
jgi:hypothetical protein